MAKKKNKKVKKNSKPKENARAKMIGQHIGYRYDVNLLPDYKKITPFLKKYVEHMGWEVQRLAPYTTRGTEVPVVLDLMIHDIDIVLALVKSQVDTIHASGLSIMTDSVDIANARIQFVDGTIANITSSRIAKDKVRKLKAFQNEMYVTIDFLLGLTEVYRIVKNKGSQGLAAVPLNENEKNKQIIYEKPTLSSFDPLRMELSNFIDSIKGKTKPIVSGSDGREALKVAIQIHEMIIKDLH